MQLRTPKIKQNLEQLSHKSSEIYTNLIILLPAPFKKFQLLPYGEVLHERMQRQNFKSSASDPFITDLPNNIGTHVSLATIDAAKDAFELLTLARKLVAAHTSAEQLAIAFYGTDMLLGERACEAVMAAALAADFAMPDYRSKPEKQHVLREVNIYGCKSSDGYKRTIAEAKGNNLARYLTALPVNQLTPALYRRRVEKIARDYGWKTEFLDSKRLRARGTGAFLAVAQGSPEPDAGILRLRYAPKTKTRPSLLALVGKGICFDTGGTNLKTAKGMYGMHEDMQGSAVALGTLLALTELRVDFPVECWLALAQNHIGPKAYKPNEVVTAANGTTIEIVHTDAEGRMVLADTLVLASAQKPKLIIDYATLTGACMQALSTRYSGAVSNRAELLPKIIEAGKTSGERVWPFPIDADYEKELKSDIADIKQCTLGAEADHILAAVFLKRFISGDAAWVHIDLSAGNHKGGLAHIPTDITGFGVRFTLNLLFEQKVMG